MLDLDLTERLAMLIAGGPGPAAPAPGDLQERCAVARDRVVAATGLEPVGELPAPEWLDRGSWAAANAASFDALLSPLTGRVGEGLGPFAGPARTAAGLVATAEAGALLGLVGKRVLGQYDLVLLDPSVPARLLFVGPNIAEAAHTLDADHDELITWVALHEVTHAVQFAAVPWLRDHLASLLEELFASMQVKVDPQALMRLPASFDVRRLAEAVRENGLVGALAGSGRREILDRIQATMALVEGHAEWAMDAAAPGLVHSLDDLRAALDRRRSDRPTGLRLLDQLLGLELKLRQYEEGRRFCDAVVAARGPEGLVQVWRSAADAPSLAELRDPAQWLSRAV